MSSREFAEWLAYYNLEPFGEVRADLRMATLAALIANANRDARKRKEPYTPRDFMLTFEDEPPRENHQTWQEQKARLMALMRPSSPPRKRPDGAGGSQ